MAASPDDLLMLVGSPGTATTLSSPGYNIGDSTINVGSTTNWPNTTGITFAIDEAELINGIETRVDGTYNEYVAIVTSGTTLGSISWVQGVGDRDYTPGSLTRVYIPVSAERENRIVEWGLVHGNQDGTLKDGAVDDPAVMATNTVTTVKVVDGAITAPKLGTSAVTGPKIADDAVTANKMVFGVLRQRQGGSSTIWTTSGTTNFDYSATDVFMQSGALVIDADPKAITFPVAFNQNPHVFVQVLTQTGANCYAIAASISTTGFNCAVVTDAGNANTGQTVNWLAIGQ